MRRFAGVWLLLACACSRSTASQTVADAAPSNEMHEVADAAVPTKVPAPGAVPSGIAPPAFRGLGRYEISSEGTLRAGWPGSGIAARFRGTSVSIEIQDFGYNFLQPTLDGKELAPIHAKKGGARQTIAIAAGLPLGDHELTIVKRTDPEFGEFALSRIVTDGELLSPPPPRKRFIEFLGDSITAGSGIEGRGPYCPLTHDVQNYLSTYAAITARNLDADHHGLAWSGKTIREMTTRFGRALPQREESRWAFAGPAPDVVVLNLGTNDFANVDPGPFYFIDRYTKLVEAVRSAYPNTFIVCMLGPILNDTYPPGRRSLTMARTYMESSVARLRAKGESKIALFEVPQQKYTDGYGCAFHPGTKTNVMIADKLTAFLKETLDW